MNTFCKFALLGALTFVGNANHALASDSRVSLGKDITVSEGETANDLVCIACSITLQGDVHGNIVSILGGVKAEGSREISGDMVSIGGDVVLPGSSSVQGDLAVIGGDLDLGPGATIHGDRTVFPGRAWLLLPFAPFLIIFGMIWLIFWLVRRNRYRFPMYPYGRGL